MELKNRSGIDFSKHEYRLVKESEDLTIHMLKIPGTVMNMIKFINVDGIMAVTGDFGNWIFCREFHPTSNGYVSDGYWLEKLKISSSQQPSKYDSERTATTIRERAKELNIELADLKKEYENKDDHTEAGWNIYLQQETKIEETLEYLEECLSNVDDELDYTYHAYRNMPSHYDYEDVIFEKTVDNWLIIIFDGFEEICKRIKEQETIN